MPITKLKLACWTIGEHAQRNILPAVKESSCIELKGLYTRNAQVLRNVGEQYSCKMYATPTDLLNDPNIEAVYISSPNSVHSEQIRLCLEYGKSIIVEKTAITDPKLAESFANIARDNKLVVLEAFMYRFHKQFSVVKSIIKESLYGRVFKVDCEFGFPHLSKDNIRYKKELSGGALYDVGAYTLSSIRHLFDDNVSLKYSHLLRDDSYQVDTKGTAILESNGIICNCSWGFGLSYSNSIRIWAEEGIIEVERAYSKRQEAYAINVLKNGSVVESRIIEPQNHFISMFEYFADALSDPSTGEDCLHDFVSQSKLLELVRDRGWQS
jgi:dTDP-3,4-didehydro-2,6-dideoxy-alpha-D-glucose 3-reductase